MGSAIFIDRWDVYLWRLRHLSREQIFWISTQHRWQQQPANFGDHHARFSSFYEEIVSNLSNHVIIMRINRSRPKFKPTQLKIRAIKIYYKNRKPFTFPITPLKSDSELKIRWLGTWFTWAWQPSLKHSKRKPRSGKHRYLYDWNPTPRICFESSCWFVGFVYLYYL